MLVFCLVQDEVDSQNPVLRDNHQLHEEVKSWLKDQKVQEIFMQGKQAMWRTREGLCLCCDVTLVLFCLNAMVITPVHMHTCCYWASFFIAKIIFLADVTQILLLHCIMTFYSVLFCSPLHLK